MKLSRFFTSLFIINILIDPGNALFHSKVITFFLFIIFNIRNNKFKIDMFFPFLLFYVFFFISAARMMLANEDYDPQFVRMYCTTFLTAGALIFTRNNNVDLWTPFKTAGFIIAASTLLIYVIILIIPQSEILLNVQTNFANVFMAAEHKRMLYWWIPSVFHKASPVLILLFGCNWHNYLRGRKTKYLVRSVFYAAALFATGTRANILSIAMVFYFIHLYYVFYVKKRMTFSVLYFLIGCAGLLFAVYLMFTVKNSSSVAKDGHVVSYIELFSGRPSYVLFGQGPGAWFYSKGFKEFTTNTELSYLELIRMFGSFFAAGIVLIYCYPLLGLLSRKTFFSFSIAISYIAYLFIAGTNPLLIGPTGFTVMAMGYYFRNHRDVCIT